MRFDEPPAGIDLLARAEALAQRAQAAWADDAQALRPEDLSLFHDAPAATRAVAARACAEAEKVATMGHDAEALRGWIDVHERLLGRDGATSAQARLELARLWLALLTWRLPPPPQDVDAWVARAGGEVSASEAGALSALLAWARGDANGARDAASRACREARRDHDDLGERLAPLVLARVRRLTGRPLLALHILTAVARAAPAPLRGWLAWELRLAGGDPARDSPDAASAIARAEKHLARLLAACHAGDRRGFDAAADELVSALPRFSFAASDADALLFALDVARAAPDDACRAWAQGETTAAPQGLHAIGLAPGPAVDLRTTAFVVVGPTLQGRRVLRPGIHLVAAARNLEDEEEENAGGARTDAAIAALACAPGGTLSREDFFRNVYGFPFVAQRHQGTLDMLVHRMRARLATSGTISRDSETSAIVLRCQDTLIVPDVRCALSLADRLLRALCGDGPASAQDAAASLGAPLRSVQAALQDMVTQGLCRAEREGRRIRYLVEDTTFDAP